MREFNEWARSENLGLVDQATNPVVVVTDHLSDVESINELLGNDTFVLLAPNGQSVAGLLQAEEPEQEIVDVGHLKVDLGEHNVCWQGDRLDLSEQELLILSCLTRDVGHAYSFRFLFQRVWGTSCHIDSAVVHSAIQRLRRKFDAANVTVRIESVPAYGFRLACHTDSVRSPAGL